MAARSVLVLGIRKGGPGVRSDSRCLAAAPVEPDGTGGVHALRAHDRGGSEQPLIVLGGGQRPVSSRLPWSKSRATAVPSALSLLRSEHGITADGGGGTRLAQRPPRATGRLFPCVDGEAEPSTVKRCPGPSEWCGSSRSQRRHSAGPAAAKPPPAASWHPCARARGPTQAKARGGRLRSARRTYAPNRPLRRAVLNTIARSCCAGPIAISCRSPLLIRACLQTARLSPVMTEMMGLRPQTRETASRDDETPAAPVRARTLAPFGRWPPTRAPAPAPPVASGDRRPLRDRPLVRGRDRWQVPSGRTTVNPCAR